jgi:formylglycine-generating enzyme required for sulfatase activity
MRLAAACASMLTSICLAAMPAHAAKRIALVIGNDHYEHVPRLHNAVADARAVAKALAGLGFQVLEGEDLGYLATNRLQTDFENAISPGDMAFVFFSGHGIAIGAENYLLPVDMRQPGAGEENLVRAEAHKVDDLVRRVQAKGAAASLFVIDACRDHPVETVGVRSIGASKGLARIDAPTGVFVLFSAGIGQSALDRLNASDRSPNSVFTRTLVPLLQQPGLTHLALAKRVQTEVKALAATVNHAQQPAFYDQIDGEIVFKPAPQMPVPSPQASLAIPPAGLSGPCRDAALAVALTTRPAQPLSAAEECSLRPKDAFRECDTCPEMVVVPTGAFSMGSQEDEKGRSQDEGPVHTVTFERPFAVGRFEVTVDQFAAFVAETGYDPGHSCDVFDGGRYRERTDRSWRDPGFAQTGSHPVVCISWNDAQAYVAWLAKKTQRDYRLLSEAEWEYAARATTSAQAQPVYSFGNDAASMCLHGNGADATAKRTLFGPDRGTVFPCDDGYAYTAPVGQFLANAFGLHDMHGNAWEWVESCYDERYALGPSAATRFTEGACNRRVLRGGSWVDAPSVLRAAYRHWSNPGDRTDGYGFRVARSLKVQ